MLSNLTTFTRVFHNFYPPFCEIMGITVENGMVESAF